MLFLSLLLSHQHQRCGQRSLLGAHGLQLPTRTNQEHGAEKRMIRMTMRICHHQTHREVVYDAVLHQEVKQEPAQGTDVSNGVEDNKHN